MANVTERSARKRGLTAPVAGLCAGVGGAIGTFLVDANFVSAVIFGAISGGVIGWMVSRRRA